MSRTALLIRCSTTEAEKIRAEAEKQHRTISGYVLQVMSRAVEFEERLYSNLTAYRLYNPIISRRRLIDVEPRTAILVRCDVEQADRIREAARRRVVPINAFVLQSLKRAWDVQTAPPSIIAPSLSQAAQEIMKA